MNETYKKLKSMVDKAAKVIEGFANESKYEKEFYDLMQDVFEYRIVEKIKRYPGGKSSLVGVEVQLYYGGPTVWVDTETKKIEGSWGLDTYSLGLTPTATNCIEEYVL